MNLRQQWLDMLIKWCIAGSKTHAWHTAKELDKTELFDGIAAELEAHMKSLNEQQLKTGG